jgi:rhamnogalacturonan endolyase
VTTLLTDEFDQLKTGMFSAHVGAHTEYHYLPEAAPHGNWNVACFASGQGAGTAWRIRETDDGKDLVQTFKSKRTDTHPMVIAGLADWKDYTVEVEFTPQEKAGRTGVVLRYRNSRCYYFLGLTETEATIIKVHHGSGYRIVTEDTLATAPCTWEAGTRQTAKVSVSGDRITAQIAGLSLEAIDTTFGEGKIGLQSDYPADFHRVTVTGEEQEQNRVNIVRAKVDQETDDLREKNPKPLLWKKISTENSGVGRNLRFGDLTGNGEIDVLITQVLHHGPKDSHSECACLTAMNFNGEVLWQLGEPDPWKDHLTNDVGVQIHDIDGDGRNEVIYCQGFEIIILDGATGAVKLKAPTPQSLPPANKFDRILGDCLFFCDLSGNGHPMDIVIKDRYWHFWVLNNKLEIQWQHEIRTGHYPYAIDIDGDGHDELALGHALFDHDGTMLWNIEDKMQDHIDGVAIANFNAPDDGELKILYAGSDSGIFFADLDGNVLKHHWIGHGQNPVIAKFRDDLPGLQTVSINFWGNQGILHFYDSDGNIYHDCEPNPFGSMCLPINWQGDGLEYFVHNPNPRWGGMYDGWGRPVVAFPNDGHPDMCNAVLDITGDCRDEVVVWDTHEIWVYTQDDGPRDGKLYNPVRNAQYNSSNYQASVSLPGWTS